MAEKMIKVSRYRTGNYAVNYNQNGRTVTYKWAGSKHGRVDTQLVPEYIVNWLLMNANTFANGSLVIEEDENSKEIVDSIDKDEEIKNNVHTREEVEKLLSGNFTKTKQDELNKITNKAEKDFVINVAKEMKLDSVAKRKFLVEWAGINSEMVFEDEEGTNEK